MSQQRHSSHPDCLPDASGLADYRILLRYLGDIQKRYSSASIEHQRKIDALNAGIMRLREEIIRRDTEIKYLRQQLSMHYAEADAVICLTGCISHGGHWLDDAHCRRRGDACQHLDAFTSTTVDCKNSF